MQNRWKIIIIYLQQQIKKITVRYHFHKFLILILKTLYKS